MAHAAYHARLLSLDSLPALQQEINHLGTDRGGVSIMAAKGILRLIRVDQIPTQAANIIKQEILARGGDLATPWSASAFAAPRVDVIFIGSLNTLRSTLSKLYRQRVYDLPAIADAVQRVLIRTTPGYLPVARQPSRQGIVVEETLDDLAGGRIPLEPHGYRANGLPTLMPLETLQWQFGSRTYIMVPISPTPLLADESAARRAAAAGADLLLLEADVPNAASPTAVAEAIRRIQECCPNVPAAVRTSRGPVAESAAAAGAAILQAAGGAEAVMRIAAEAGTLVVLPHSPLAPAQGDLLTAVADGFHCAVEEALSLGLQEEQLILDAGLGQGRSPEQNREVLRRLRELTSFGRPLLVEPMPAAIGWSARLGATFPDAGAGPEPAAIEGNTGPADTGGLEAACPALQGAACTALTLAVAHGANFVTIPSWPALVAAVRASNWLTQHPEQ